MRKEAQLIGSTLALIGLVGWLTGCQRSTQESSRETTTPTYVQETEVSLSTPSPTATARPSATVMPVIDTREYQLIGTPDSFVSPSQFIFVAADDADGKVVAGFYREVNLNEQWRVRVLGQSPDGLFLNVVFLEADVLKDSQAYIGVKGWIYSYWAGFAEPLLPAEFEVITEPEDLNAYRQPYFNYSLSVIGATMEAQGTAHPDDYVLPALNATQTQWAVLQTPQP